MKYTLQELKGYPITAASIQPDTIRCVDKEQTEVMRIAADGRIFWRGREVETDDDFRAAMLELRDALMGMKR